MTVNPGAIHWPSRRRAMVDEQLIARGIRDPRVLETMASVPRERFVPAESLEYSCHDGPLRIAAGQTISQPYIVARMTEMLALEGGERVLEIGTGSGYQTAVLAALAREVVSVEIIPELSRAASELLDDLGIGNVRLVIGDGRNGFPEAAPFDRLLVTAAPAEFPVGLLSQLAMDAIAVAPVGEELQWLTIYRARRGEWTSEKTLAVTFVPLV
jgi:protein-L-isoaspartate(D-aspartate) O-methyltransferase